LRVTEQDVVNEEMYEEEDDDLPTQYQRLNAHLQTSSWLFNRKLHDYIATQAGVRNMFLQQQFPGGSMQPYGSSTQSNTQMPFINSSMLPPQTFNPATQGFTQQSQPYLSQSYQQPQPGYRHAPYNIPQRPQPHQRSASISTPQATQNYGQAISQASSAATTPGGDTARRMSLPPHTLEQAAQQGNDVASRPSLSRTSTSQSVQQPASPSHISTPTSGPATPSIKSEQTSPTSCQYPLFPFDTSSQVLNMNPLSLSLPPESQQFMSSTLDPNDPRTAIFMAGSENLPQPFMGTYTYNPNLSPKSTQVKNVANHSGMPTGFSASGMTQTLAPEDSIKLERAAGNATSNTSSSILGNGCSSQLLTPTGFDYTGYFDQYQSTDGSRTHLDSMFSEPFEESSFVNWDQ
jgi:hypothetical protein